VEHAKEERWFHVMKTKLRDLYELQSVFKRVYNDDDGVLILNAYLSYTTC